MLNKKIECLEIARKIQATACLISIVKLSVFSILFFSIQTQTGIAQVRPNPQQMQEEMLIRLLRNTKRAKTIAEIPAPFVEIVKRDFEQNPENRKEKIKFEQFLANRYFWAFETIENENWVKGTPTPKSEMCDLGILAQENRLNPSVWTAAWTGGNTSVISDANLPISVWTSGFVGNSNLDIGVNNSCGNHSTQNHHSVVSTASDITVSSLSTTPAGQSRSILLGNRCFANGAEKIKKTFTVTSNTLSFWYATVMTDRHGPNFSTQPGFGVYLFDSVGNPILPSSTGLDLDSSQVGMNQFLPANATNPFQQSIAPASSNNNNPILYKNWTPVSIDLSAYIGTTVTIVFANRDCLGFMDWAYTYISGFCSSTLDNPSGSAEFNKPKSDCAKGEICFDYTVPKATNGTTGKVNLNLELYQNGNLVTTLTSGDLTSNGTYCFKNFSGALNSSVAGFDWKATANFTIAGATISPKEIGKRGDGFVEGQNNDCVTKSCCGIGKNFVRNGDFRETNSVFRADYPFTRANPFLFPGTELIGDSRIAEKACDRWDVSGHARGKCEDNSGDTFLMINGRTTQANSNPAVVWSQEVKVDGEGEYEFCAFFKNLKQCCFNQNPKITLQATIDGKVTAQTATISTSEKACDWQQVSSKITVPLGASSVNLQILLDESVIGDGNDLAIDDISLTKKEQVANNFLTTNPQLTDNAAGDKFTVKTTTPPPPSPDCKTVWKTVEFKRDASGKLLKDSNGDLITDPATYKEWINPPSPFEFFGYNSATGIPGVFDSAKLYRITYGVECDCLTYKSRSWKVGLDDSMQLRPAPGQKRKSTITEELPAVRRSNPN